MDALLLFAGVAGFVLGIPVGGKWMLVLIYRYGWSSRRVIVFGIVAALLSLLLSQITFLELIFQLIEAVLGGGVAGVGAGLALYGYFFQTGNVEQINAIWMNFFLFSDDERKKLAEEAQKREKR